MCALAPIQYCALEFDRSLPYATYSAVSNHWHRYATLMQLRVRLVSHGVGPTRELATARSDSSVDVVLSGKLAIN